MVGIVASSLSMSCSTSVAELSDKRSFLDLTIKCLIKMVKLLPGELFGLRP